MRLTLERRGQFAARAFLGPSQCGKKGVRLFRYRARITVVAQHLDPRGFVADHDDVHRWFVDQFGREGSGRVPSCEAIAMRAAAGLQKLAPWASAIEVTVAGSGHASVTARWEI